MKAERDAIEKEKFWNALIGPVQQYQTISWEEIMSATSSFSGKLIIGILMVNSWLTKSLFEKAFERLNSYFESPKLLLELFG
ncbi:hypothetical protein Ddye_013286 [Dipteronia dyeriana]|uniref:Uncharacterized protein n=1 Tax=Dipteronia dyeriana TaxID=168575 RepID=A0AAD9X5V5_9ROSI|nr:hypothetical protein Ddye_013286 [Dipteronia dyeriana]